MITNHTVTSLRAFESRIASNFNDGLIRAPVHLSGGNEKQLIEIFQDIQQEDYIAVSWRSHYHCLLKGVPEEELYRAILDKRSIALCFPEYRILGSAIVGGSIPIALGVAMALKRQNSLAKVWCFVGDMTELTGIFRECLRYASRNDLSMKFVAENNGLSVCTPTMEAWGQNYGQFSYHKYSTYTYENEWPHSGAGRRVNF